MTEDTTHPINIMLEILRSTGVPIDEESFLRLRSVCERED